MGVDSGTVLIIIICIICAVVLCGCSSIADKHDQTDTKGFKH